MSGLVHFDCEAVYDALDERRQAQGLGWYELAEVLWEQSSDLNAQRVDDHPLCGGALQRLQHHERTSCQYVLFMLRWLNQVPEDFCQASVNSHGSLELPTASSDERLRWDLGALHGAVDKRRQATGLTWAALGRELGCSPARLTNLRTARTADMSLVLQLTQWLDSPSVDFIHAERW